MKPKSLAQFFVLALTFGIYLISAACLGSPTPTPDPFVEIAQTATGRAHDVEATLTRRVTGTPRTPTRSRTPTVTPSGTRRPTLTPSVTASLPPTLDATLVTDPNLPTLSFAEIKATRDHDPTVIKRRTDQAANALKALLVQGGPPDVPGWEGPSQITQADPTHLTYYLEQDFLMDKLPEIYSDWMPKYGWTRKQASATTLIFTKEGRTATITFSLEPDRRVKVTIVIT